MSQYNFKNEKGKRYGRLLIIERLENDKWGNTAWLCLCDCGNKTIVSGGNLRKHTRSCGCRSHDLLVERNTTHGKSGGPEHQTWANMLTRCRNKNTVNYVDYGGRGITVCKEWLKFEQFYADMGDKPKGMTIERIDNMQGYSPDNCKWATRTEQGQNKRNNRIITFNDKSQTIAEWANETNIDYFTLRRRLDAGWDAERMLTEPVYLGKNQYHK